MESRGSVRRSQSGAGNVPIRRSGAAATALLRVALLLLSPAFSSVVVAVNLGGDAILRSVSATSRNVGEDVFCFYLSFLLPT